MDLVTWLRAQLDDDERWALAANRPYEYADEGSAAPAGGVHWRWVVGENWETARPDPAVTEFVEGPDRSWSANLATVEEWPSTMRIDAENSRTSMMPRVYANSIEEMDASAAGHIARHDPARVLAEVDAKRKLLDWLERKDDWAAQSNLWSWDSTEALALLALPYADREGYREEWRP